MQKMASRKIFQHFLHNNFSMFILLIVSLNFKLICTCEFFNKLKMPLLKRLMPLNSKAYDYLY